MNNEVYRAPEEFPDHQYYIFLGGSIDDGQAEDWQEKFCREFPRTNFSILNPRRNNWGKISERKMLEQIRWERRGQMLARHILYNFLPNSKSPITLMELGEYAYKNMADGTGNTVQVICNKDFYRYMNVKVLCDEYEINVFPDMETFMKGGKFL